ncbi:DUF3375 domain-containing protein [Gordonibacter sp.]|uniref:DUF3375 domain-containing protein n=1 Tax=Gordonibacter sp. TaxID=1968902 RepID=UPI002FC98B88
MSATSTALHLQRLKDESIAWKLLRSKRAPLVIAILDAHFTGDVRRIAVPEFISLVDIDLEDARFRTSIEVRRSAQAYCERWRADGYLIRRSVPQSRQETYELSSGALAAIQYAKRLMQPHRTATQSRLGLIIDQISSLALATDDNEEHRRQALLEERARLDAQINLLDQGQFEVIDEEKALEKARDIVNLAREIPVDFVHVRNDFEQINRSLYDTIINYDEGHKEILADIFDGVDEIAQTASGQSFKGFYSLLRNADLSETLQDDIDSILECDFAVKLGPEDRRFLRGLMQVFIDQSQEVNGVMTSFAHGLRRFVQSQNYRQERALKKHIDRALGRAHRMVEYYPSTYPLRDELNLTSVQIAPVSRWKLKNPAENQAVPLSDVVVSESEEITFEQLREIARETEIDFFELAQNVNDCLSSLEVHVGGEAFRSSLGATVKDILTAFPPTQGIASIVGLVVLGIEQGQRREGSETVPWIDDNGRTFRATIPHLAFNRKVHA